MRDKFKGTKGAWKVNKLEATDYYTERNEIHYGEDGECVAEFVADDFDAKLIASAPEMLEALMDLENDNNSIPKPIWDKVQNAIKKALT